MARSFDLNGGGEQPTEGTGFDAANAGVGTGGADSNSVSGDAFGATSFGDGPADPRGGDYVFDADIHIGRDRRNANGTYRRKRQRRGSGGQRTANPRSKADLSASIDGLTKVLLVMHVGMAEMTKTPELVLTEVEANTLATSTANVLEHFDIAPDPKVQAIIGLLMTAGMIYGPRMYNIKERAKTEKKSKATVHTLRPVDNNSQMVDETRL